MRRERLPEVHFIAPLSTVPSILHRGVLSHQRASSIPHTSVADEVIQERRRAVRVPGGRSLHHYANLYLHARNAMLYRLVQTSSEPLAVLAIDSVVVDRPGVVITDRNAASGTARFLPAPSGLEDLDEDVVFARWWNQSRDERQRRQAEVLVPDRVEPELVVRAYVADERDREGLTALVGQRCAVVVDADLFFRGG